MWRASLRNFTVRESYRAKGALIARLPVAAIAPLAAVAWRVQTLFDARARWRGAERCEFALSIAGGAPIDTCSVATTDLRERLIDQRIYFGRHLRGAEAWPDLQSVANELAALIRQLQAASPGRPIFVSPFHYVSQYANIYVIDELRALLGLESIAVVSGVPRNKYGEDHAQIPGVQVLYTYGEDNRNGLGLRLARSLRRSGIAVLFADVPPFALYRFPMETVDVSMFGRAARIHNGVFRLGAQFEALLLPFYLRFERGRFSGEVLAPLELTQPDAPQRLAQQIENALIDNCRHSLIAGHPSMYSFSASK
ncbi:hypothetical protein DLM46_00180 [Paraburkholderia lacunae]|uniref:Uncharacterized protein n=1 Tax=Paraburkholderia lacunae TaxID=2211104 RepID=A0A370NFG4_9BURK|nr:hypothetical protein DLM46_00180 [Paraburkholderia lacunae]